MLASVVVLLSILARRFTPLAIMVRERTFIAVKPDGVQRGLTGEIIKRFEAKGFKLVGMKFMQATEEHLKKHYADLADKPFYPGLCKYMSSGPLVAMCWEGTGVVKTARTMMGETRPADSKPGTIRGDFCIEVGRNIIHGSDSVESANKEVDLWFKPEELFSWTQANETWIYEFTEFFGDVSTTCGLQTLNQYLENNSYLQGHTPSQVDAQVFSALIEAPQETYSHVLRWYNHIKTLGVELKLTLEEEVCSRNIPDHRMSDLPENECAKINEASNYNRDNEGINLSCSNENEANDCAKDNEAISCAKDTEVVNSVEDKEAIKTAVEVRDCDDDDLDVFGSNDKEQNAEAVLVCE